MRGLVGVVGPPYADSTRRCPAVVTPAVVRPGGPARRMGRVPRYPHRVQGAVSRPRRAPKLPGHDTKRVLDDLDRLFFLRTFQRNLCLFSDVIPPQNDGPHAQMACSWGTSGSNFLPHVQLVLPCFQLCVIAGQHYADQPGPDWDMQHVMGHTMDTGSGMQTTQSACGMVSAILPGVALVVCTLCACFRVRALHWPRGNGSQDISGSTPALAARVGGGGQRSYAPYRVLYVCPSIVAHMLFARTAAIRSGLHILLRPPIPGTLLQSGMGGREHLPQPRVVAYHSSAGPDVLFVYHIPGCINIT